MALSKVVAPDSFATKEDLFSSDRLE